MNKDTLQVAFMAVSFFTLWKLHENTMATKANTAAIKAKSIRDSVDVNAVVIEAELIRDSVDANTAATKTNTAVTAEVQDSLQVIQFVAKTARRVFGVFWRG